MGLLRYDPYKKGNQLLTHCTKTFHNESSCALNNYVWFESLTRLRKTEVTEKLFFSDLSEIQ